jgi:hypothetical protein
VWYVEDTHSLDDEGESASQHVLVGIIDVRKYN